jgi:hypothetical protein
MEERLEEFDEQEKLVAYLSKWVDDFDPEEAGFKSVSTSLKMNDKGKVKLGGFFWLPFLGLFLGAFVNGYYVIDNFEYYSTLGLVLLGSLVALQLISIPLVFKRFMYAKWTITMTYVLLIVVSLLGRTEEYLTALLWGAYILFSKRVKYTLVEKMRKDNNYE